MPRCGCRGDSCSCIVVAGRNARVRGSGNQNNPYIIDALPMSILPDTTETIAVHITGTGTATDPWIVSADDITPLSGTVWKRWVGTQAEYDALGVYDPNTLYLVT